MAANIIVSITCKEMQTLVLLIKFGSLYIGVGIAIYQYNIPLNITRAFD